MTVAFSILVFLILFLALMACSHRLLLGKQYSRYKRHAIQNKHPYNWVRFFFAIQLNPDFPEMYGRVSKGRLFLAGCMALGGLAIFAQLGLQ